MKVRLKGGSVCFLQDSGERVISHDSVATSSATWFVYPFSSAKEYAPIVNKSEHPIWSGLYCKSVGTKRYGEGAIITAQYEGAESWDSEKDSDENTLEVSCTMREEPIESHPNFLELAGTPKSPKNGAVFDNDGKFTGWKVVENAKPQELLAGIKSYLVPSYSATISYISRGIPSLGGISKIGGDGLPSVGENYQWMCTGISFSSMADNKYKVTKNFLLSGPSGWNKKIYK